MDIEEIVRRALAAATGVPVLYEVPATRPAEFVTVELSGDTRRESGALCDALVTAKCWAADRKAALELYGKAAAAPAALMAADSVMAAHTASAFRDRDLESGWHRYQLVFQIKYSI